MIFVFGWVMFAVVALLLLPSTVALLMRRLEPTNPHALDPASWPLVSVIVPARDEAAAIEAGLRSLLASNYPNLEIVAVDDRSSDATGGVMDRLAREDSRLRAIHVTALPENWLGKSHAMHVAAASARGEILLFTDGDVVFRPDAIRSTVRLVESRKLDHLCLIPGNIPGSYLENSLVAYFGLAGAAVAQSWLVPTSFPHVYAGIGAFNMVRREAYERIGGHEPIRLDVLDDMKLGKMLKRAGFRQDIRIGGDAVRVKWQSSAWGIVRGLEKNGFAAADYSLLKLLCLTVPMGILLLVPYAAVATFQDVRSVGYAATIILLHSLYALFGRLLGAGWKVAPMLPVAGFVLMFAIWRSAFLTLRRQGVRWRETFYPLALLREHRYD